MKSIFVCISLLVASPAFAIGQVALCDGPNLKLHVFSPGGNVISACDECFLIRTNEEKVEISALKIETRDSSAYRKPEIIQVTQPELAGFYLHFDASTFMLSAIDSQTNDVLANAKCRRMDL